MLLLYIVSILISFVAAQTSNAHLDVQLDQGPVRGYKDPEANLFAFYGIPYATEPKGSEKFKAPLDAPTWTETFEAVNDSLICLQPSRFVPGKIIAENCLIANVYVPNTNETDLPVLVQIHGGGLQVFYGNFFTPKRFVEENNIIVVNFNYRLGANGFLCLGTEMAPGNAGFKDMLALLRWVNTNIENFGGNPDDVTLTGYSSGAHAADLFLMTRSEEGLFHKLSLESGNGITNWGIQMDPTQHAQDFAAQFNFTSTDTAELEQFYLNLPNDDLVSAASQVFADGHYIFTGCIENDLGNETEPFLTDAPINLITTYKNLPLMNGFTNGEGLLYLAKYQDFQDSLNANFSNHLPSDLTFPSQEEKETVAAEVRSFYFADATIDNSTASNYVNYISDIDYISPTLRSLKSRVEANLTSIYIYEYSYYDNSQSAHLFPTIGGANHNAQTYAVFEFPRNGIFYNETGLTKNFISVKKQMRALWSNFVKTGEPVPDGSTTDLTSWPVSGADASPYATLDLFPVLNTIPWSEDRSKLWMDIYSQYQGVPIPPTP